MSQSLKTPDTPIVGQRTWDIYCAVIDNYGDVGVCWRLARHLAAANILWVDGHASGRSAESIGQNPVWFTRYSRYNGWTKTFEETTVGEWSAGGPIKIVGIR